MSEWKPIEIAYHLGMVHCDLDFLLKAIEEGDSPHELLRRVKELRRMVERIAKRKDTPCT